ncbi:hypothetical protein Tco_0164133 [Tanacetum coccineum]
MVTTKIPTEITRHQTKCQNQGLQAIHGPFQGSEGQYQRNRSASLLRISAFIVWAWSPKRCPKSSMIKSKTVFDSGGERSPGLNQRRKRVLQDTMKAIDSSDGEKCRAGKGHQLISRRRRSEGHGSAKEKRRKVINHDVDPKGISQKEALQEWVEHWMDNADIFPDGVEELRIEEAQDFKVDKRRQRIFYSMQYARSGLTPRLSFARLEGTRPRRPGKEPVQLDGTEGRRQLDKGRRLPKSSVEEKIVINDNYPEQLVTIGRGLTAVGIVTGRGCETPGGFANRLSAGSLWVDIDYMDRGRLNEAGSEYREVVLSELPTLYLPQERRGHPDDVDLLQRGAAETNYAPMEKLALALVHAARRLRRYFQAHPIKFITDSPIGQVLNNSGASGRLGDIYTMRASTIEGSRSNTGWALRIAKEDAGEGILAFRRLQAKWPSQVGRKSYLVLLMRYVGPLQANYVIREVHMGSCGMHDGPRQVVAKAMNLGTWIPSNIRMAIYEKGGHGIIVGPLLEGPRFLGSSAYHHQGYGTQFVEMILSQKWGEESLKILN